MKSSNINKQDYQKTLESFDTRVRSLCKQQGISLRSLAVFMKVQPDSLIRSLKNNPTLKTMQIIAECLGCDVVDLLPSSQYSQDMRGILTYKKEYYIIESPYDLIQLAKKFEHLIENEE